MARPSVWRWEFQQVDKEYIVATKKAGRRSLCNRTPGRNYLIHYKSAWRALNMAENRAAFCLRRRRSLGFSKCRCWRTSTSVPSRPIFFFNRRKAFSTDSPFFNLISVNAFHFLSDVGTPADAPVRGNSRKTP